MQKKNDASHFAHIAKQVSSSGTAAVRFDRSHRYNSDLVAARFRLDNGLTVVAMPDSRAALFTLQTWFRVGSADEDPNLTGLAHLFEHLMFRGTGRYPDGAIDREVGLRGGDADGATSWDWTHYTTTLASRGDNLKLLLELEADRMVNLRLDAEVFEREREVVRNERRTAVEDSPGGFLQEQLLLSAFSTHPYRWPVLGSLEHLDKMAVTDLQHFYDTYYAPNNAVIVVAGDVDCGDALTLINEAFGALAPSDRPQRVRDPEPAQEAPRHGEWTLDVSSPRVLAAYHAPAFGTLDFAALEIWNEILCTGDNGRLYRRLVIDEGVATAVNGTVESARDPGVFEVGMVASENAQPKNLLRLLDEELGALPGSATEAELDKAIHGLELGFYESLMDPEQCAETLGHYECICDDFSITFRWLDWYADVDANRLNAVAEGVFRNANRTAVVGLPRPP